MKGTLWIAACALLIGACSRPGPTDTVESLMSSPERLEALRAQCKADREKVGDALCNAVSEASRRNFMGKGTPYTPSRSVPDATGVRPLIAKD